MKREKTNIFSTSQLGKKNFENLNTTDSYPANAEMITVDDCIVNFSCKNMAVVLDNGKVSGFVNDR